MIFKMAIAYILKYGFWIVALCGLIYQVTVITITYLAYNVSNSINMEVPKLVDVPSSSFCFSSRLLIDRNSTTFERYVKQPATGTISQTDYRQVALRYKVSELFTDTPSVEKLLLPNRPEACLMRNTIDGTSHYFDSNTCPKYVLITKFVYQEYMCYEMTPIGDFSGQLSYHQTLSQMEYSSAIYQFMLNLNQLTWYRPLDYILMVVSDNGRNLVDNLRMARRLRQGTGSYLYTFESLDIVRLPPPYSTKCYNYETTRLDCVNQCLVQSSIEILKSIPYMAVVNEFDHYDLNSQQFQLHAWKLSMDTNDTINTYFNMIYKHIETQCNTRCESEECHSKLMLTLPFGYTSRPDILTMRLIVPVKFSTNIEFTPIQTLMDYLVYISSCFGLWLGMSFADLNPLKWVEIVRHRARQPVTTENAHFMMNVFEQRMLGHGRYLVRLEQRWLEQQARLRATERKLNMLLGQSRKWNSNQ